MNLRVFSSVASLFLFAFSCFGQYDPDSVFDKNALIEDLYSLKSTIMETHPNPFGFCSRDEFNDSYTHAVSYLNDNRSLGDFCKTVATVMQVMKDSHSGIDYEYLQEMQLLNGGYILPLQLMSLTGGIYLVKDRDSLIDAGSRIVCINNVDVEQLYAEALRYACIEGNAVSAQHRVADAILPVVIGLSTELGPEVRIDIEQNKESEFREILFPTYDQNRWKARKKRLYRLDFRETMSLEIDKKENTAVLMVGTFAPYDAMKYQKFIKKSFRKINDEGIENLVIDVRGNGGGSSSWVEYVYSYLDTSGYNTPDNIIGRNSKLARERSRKMITPSAQWVIRNFYRKNEDVQNFMKVLNLAEGESDTVYFSKAVVQRKSKVYHGDCYILINGLTASAAVDFTNAFRQRKRGIIIGESCLGPITGTWGNPAPYILPNSGIKVNIATIRYNYDRSFRYEQDPIKPDHEVATDPDDLRSGKDTQVNFARKLIQQKKNDRTD